jgi:hypothetical protein
MREPTDGDEGDSSVVRLVRLLSGVVSTDVVTVQIGDGPDCLPDGSQRINVNDPVACARLGASKLCDERPDVRQAALELVQRDDGVLTTCADLVESLLRDPVWFVRKAAVGAAARLLPLSAHALGAVVTRLREDDTPDVRVAAARALQHDQARVPLVDAAKDDEAWAVRAAAVGMRARAAFALELGLRPNPRREHTLTCRACCSRVARAQSVGWVRSTLRPRSRRASPTRRQACARRRPSPSSRWARMRCLRMRPS